MNDIYEKYGLTDETISSAFKNIDLSNINIPKFSVPEIPYIPPNPVTETNRLLEEQNELLQDQLAQLRDQNKALKKQADDSNKDARRNLIFGWISFGVGTFIGIAGVIVGIIF